MPQSVHRRSPVVEPLPTIYSLSRNTECRQRVRLNRTSRSITLSHVPLLQIPLVTAPMQRTMPKISRTLITDDESEYEETLYRPDVSLVRF